VRTATPHATQRFPSSPERLGRVQVATSGGTSEISWATRTELLRRLRHHDGTLAVVRTFEAVGASRPVELTDGAKHVLLGVVSAWVDADDAPEEVAELRRELLDDLDAAGFWRK
jgi:hypothetical protein